MENKIKFGIIGCGLAGDRHAQAISQIPDAVLTSVSSGSKSSAQSLAKKYPGTIAIETSELLQSNQVDVVCICSPNGFHYSQLKDTLASGKAAIVEKPIVMNLKEINNLIIQNSTTQKPVLVVFPRRFDDTTIQLIELFSKKQLTGLKYFSIEMLYLRQDSYYQDSSWHGDPKLDGGVILTQGIHYLDLFAKLYTSSGQKLDLLNKLKHHTIGIKLNKYAQVNNTISSHFAINNDLIASLNITTSASPGQGAKVSLVCDQGTITLISDKISNWNIKDVPEPQGGTNGWDILAVKPVIQNMVDHLKNGTPLLSALDDTIASHQLAMVLSK